MNFANTIAFINPKSGSKHGPKVYVKLCLLLGKEHVFDLTQGGPEPGLRKYRRHENLRVIACGGDGTVGWIHSCIDRIKFLSPPSVVPFPLGTGNDMSRVLGWGANYAGESVMPILEAIEEGIPVEMDRWMVSSDPLEENDLIELQSLICSCDKSFSDDYEYSSSQEMETFATSSNDKSESAAEESSAPVNPTPPPSWLSQRRLRFHSVSELPVRSTTYSGDSEVPTLAEKRKRDRKRRQLEISGSLAITPSLNDDSLQSSSPSPLESPVIELPPKKSKRKANKNISSATLPSPRDSPLDDTMSTATIQSETASELDVPTPKTKKRTTKHISSSVSELPCTPSSPSPNMLSASVNSISTIDADTSHSSTDETIGSLLSPNHEPQLPTVTLNGANDIVSVDFYSDSSSPGPHLAAKNDISSESTVNASPSCPDASFSDANGDVNGSNTPYSIQAVPEVEKARIIDPTSLEDPLSEGQRCEGTISLEVPTLGSVRRKLASSEGVIDQERPRKKKSKKPRKKQPLAASMGLDSVNKYGLDTTRSDMEEIARDDAWRTQSGPVPERPSMASPNLISENRMSEVPSPVTTPSSVESNEDEGGKDENSKFPNSEGLENGVIGDEECGKEKKVDEGSASPSGVQNSSKSEECSGDEKSALCDSTSISLDDSGANLCAPRSLLSSSVSLKRIPDLELVASTSSITSSSKRSAERKTLVMNNYFSVGVDSMVALEFHNKREAMPSLFPHHVINKAWYGIFGLKHAMLNSFSSKAKTPDLRRVMKLALDGEWVEIPKGVEAIVFLQIPSYSSGTNVWGDASKTKGQKQAPTVSDGLFEVVAMKGIMHLGALQAGWSSGIRLGQASSATIYNLAVVPVQCDGEPWLLPPCKTTINFHNQSSMLFNILSGAKRFRSVTGLSPPSFGLSKNEQTPTKTHASTADIAGEEMEEPEEIGREEKEALRKALSQSNSSGIEPLPSPNTLKQNQSETSGTNRKTTLGPLTPSASSSIPRVESSHHPALLSTRSASVSLAEPSALSAHELRAHIRGNHKAAYLDVPTRVRASRQTISSPELNPKPSILPVSHT